MFDRQQDLKTIRRCKRGEEAAFAEILGRYRGAIYNLCYRMTRNAEDARDLGQEVFIKVFSLLDRFDEADCGVETSIEIECPECFAEQTVDLPFGREFFLPRKKTTRARTASRTSG